MELEKSKPAHKEPESMPRMPAFWPTPEGVKEELWEADPHCEHEVVAASGGGCRCTKCPGWFCY